MANNPRGGNRPKRPQRHGGNRPNNQRHSGGNRPNRPKPNRPKRDSSSGINIIEIAGTVLTLIDQLSGKKPASAEPNELQTYSDLLEKELAKEKPDKHLIAALLKKIKEGTAPSGEAKATG